MWKKVKSAQSVQDLWVVFLLNCKTEKYRNASLLNIIFALLENGKSIDRLMMGWSNKGQIVPSEKADAAIEGGIVTTLTHGGKAG